MFGLYTALMVKFVINLVFLTTPNLIQTRNLVLSTIPELMKEGRHHQIQDNLTVQAKVGY